jgi:signal peptidase II
MREGVARGPLFLTGLAVFALDRVTKYLVEQNLSPEDVKTAIPGFLDIVKSQNPGVAFGILAGATSPFRTTMLIVFSLAAVASVGAMIWRSAKLDMPTAIGLALIFGGAMGNIFDRIIHGSVTDFLDAHIGNHHWYTFNVADSAISVGASLILLGMLLPAPVPGRKLET